MKFILVFLSVSLTSFIAQAEEIESLDTLVYESEETGESVLSPEAAQEHFDEMEAIKGIFQQTRWYECDDDITGNYSGFNCTNRRGISAILEEFKNRNFYRCVNQALAKVGKSRAVDLHVIHDGIQGDANHSPRSLHAEARAIDIDSFVVTYNSGRTEKITFKSSSSNSFFNEFRSCWGRAVHEQNGCPLISGRYGLTGSIGKEDRNHQNHVHVSVPYCIRGTYSARFFRR